MPNLQNILACINKVPGVESVQIARPQRVFIDPDLGENLKKA